MKAIQDTYEERFAHCFGCGAKNEKGLHLKSYPNEEGDKCVLTFTPAERFTGGIPGNLYGGMTAMAFDCHGTASAAWFFHRAKGLSLTDGSSLKRFITARLEIDYKKPVPMGKEVTVTAVADEIGERKVIVEMTLEAAGELRARARMVAVAVKDDM